MVQSPLHSAPHLEVHLSIFRSTTLTLPRSRITLSFPRHTLIQFVALMYKKGHSEEMVSGYMPPALYVDRKK